MATEIPVDSGTRDHPTVPARKVARKRLQPSGLPWILPALVLVVGIVYYGIIDTAYHRAHDLLTTNSDKLHAMAKALLLYETIDSEQIGAIMEGREPGPPKDWQKSNEGGAGPTSSAGSKPAPPIGGTATQH